VKNILTFDVEDWYHGLGLAAEYWNSVEKRLPVGLEFVLAELSRQRVAATFFVLGMSACDHPDAIRRIAAAGHEIGTHGWSHTAIYRQERPVFRSELRRSLELIEGLSGRPVRGHRAAMFSITAESLWALDELSAAGLAYDSSIFPVHNYRYGIPGALRFPYRLPRGRGLWELPVATIRLVALNLPFGGGFYARFWPYAWLKRAIGSLNAHGHPAVVYFHPWEFDPQQPRLRAGSTWLARTTHYFRLASTRATLKRLLNDFEWCGALQYVCEEVSC
jgi:polysaccharide deacetylase family protein (PEP-CTERM system associated)